MVTFVLVHGAWHGSWCWEKLSAHLVARGHRAVAPDLPGHGAHVATEPVSLSTYCRHICAILEELQENVVLVGHSMGGSVISQVAEEFPHLISKLIYVCAFLPRNGESIMDLIREIDEGLPAGVTAIDAATNHLKICDGADLDVFYGQCSMADKQQAHGLLCPQPVRPLADAVILSPGNFGRLSKAYILCQNDNLLPPMLQRFMAARAEADLHYLASDHSPFLSMPEALADRLHAIAESLNLSSKAETA